jgi:hypothetical protein
MRRRRSSDHKGTVALCDRRACRSLADGRLNQIASLSFSNAVASRSTGEASTPNS